MAKQRLLKAMAIALMVVSGGFASAYMGWTFSTNPAVVDSDVEIHGRIIANGAQGYPDGFGAAIIADPIDPRMFGLLAVSEDGAGVVASSTNGTALDGLSPNGTAVLGHAWGANAVGVIARNTKGGIALRIEGRMEKAMADGNQLTIYDDAGAVIGSWRFSFD